MTPRWTEVRSGQHWTVVLTRQVLPAEPASVPVLRHRVVRAAESAGASPDVLSAIALAVSEATTNVVVHAYRDEDGPGEVEVAVDCDAGDVVIRIADSGGGLAPRPDSPGLGLGMAMMAAVSARLDVTSRPGGGAEVCLRFHLAE